VECPEEPPDAEADDPDPVLPLDDWAEESALEAVELPGDACDEPCADVEDDEPPEEQGGTWCPWQRDGVPRLVAAELSHIE
jgi:hypothetical protein